MSLVLRALLPSKQKIFSMESKDERFALEHAYHWRYDSPRRNGET